MPLLSIIIVSWNCKGIVLKCLESIFRTCGSLEIEIIVIDNASSDGTAEAVRKNYPEVVLIASDVNFGFPKANNVGFAKAKGKYLLALNPDTIVEPGSLETCVRFLDENESYGCVGVKTVLPNKKIQYHCARQFPTLRSFVFGYFFLDKIFPRVRFFRSPDMPFWDHKESRDVEMIQGAFMMFRKNIYEKIGGFDERLPMFLEDGEYCLRLSRHGYKIRYLADVSITHFVGQSTEQSKPRWIASLRYEANYIFLREYQRSPAAFLYLFFVFIASPLRAALLPLFSFALWVKSGNGRLRLYFWETITGWLWFVRKIFSFMFSDVKNKTALSALHENSI
jgi:GT2 family glycosyltransferase